MAVNAPSRISPTLSGRSGTIPTRGAVGGPYAVPPPPGGGGPRPGGGCAQPGGGGAQPGGGGGGGYVGGGWSADQPGGGAADPGAAQSPPSPLPVMSGSPPQMRSPDGHRVRGT